MCVFVCVGCERARSASSRRVHLSCEALNVWNGSFLPGQVGIS